MARAANPQLPADDVYRDGDVDCGVVALLVDAREDVEPASRHDMNAPPRGSDTSWSLKECINLSTFLPLERPQMTFQVLSLFLLALPIASIAWTITHEEVVREFRDVCLGKSTTCRRIYERKFFYLFTCEYCFSHYVAAVFLLITRFKLLYPDWRGYLIAGFSLVWVANVYMSLFARIRLEVKRERVQIKKQEKGVE
jgi:hypothetical protein